MLLKENLPFYWMFIIVQKFTYENLFEIKKFTYRFKSSGDRIN